MVAGQKLQWTGEHYCYIGQLALQTAFTDKTIKILPFTDLSSLKEYLDNCPQCYKINTAFSLHNLM